ncbi:SpoIID/LytB domain-containing protein [Planococcus sp. 1R117A]|uniref:SpoIID/LytB domain-containing protein n=1 Tax=Planococcus sp. 1R117A TaxID=3447020 RepID=UPI003EDBE03E
MKSIIKGFALILFFSLLAVTIPTESASAADFTVKVKLNNKLGPSATYHFVPKGASVLKEAPTVVLAKDRKYTVTVSAGKLVVKDGTKILASGLSTVTIEPKIYAKENHLYLYKGALTEAHPYMGTILFRLSGTALMQPVNMLQFEDYLKGVVPSESPASWGSPAAGGMEALKAQAIAARSYVFSKMSQSTLEIDDTTTYQVYQGFIWDPLSPKYLRDYQYSNQAVTETQGQILTYVKADGKKGFVTAFFSSSNGGQTELAEQYWSSPLPYITKSQKDPYDTSNVLWKLTWLKQQLPASLNVQKPESWWDITTEYNLNSSMVANSQSREAFKNYKAYVLSKAKVANPAIESIKIASIDSIQTSDYENTGKVKETKVDVTYYARTKTNNALAYDMEAGAASKTLSGIDRYETAAKIAAEYVGAAKAKTIVLGGGSILADALAGTVLAHKHRAPIMLVRNNSLPASVEQFINEKTEAGATIYILGGESAISPEIQDKLTQKGFKTIRLSGKDRTATSLAIAKEIGSSSKVMIANGEEGSSDALSASAYAANKQIPIIIQRGTKLAEQTKTFLKDNASSSAIIIGGKGVVPETVETELMDMNIKAERISGSNRVETSIAINRELPLTGNSIVIGNAYRFVDALAGSVLAAKTGSPIVLLDPDPAKLPAAFFESMPTKSEAFFLGGSGVISEDLKAAVNQYVGKAINKHQMTLTFNGSKSLNGNPSMTTFRTTLGGVNLKSLQYGIIDQEDRFIMDGSGFGHGIGLSQWGSYKRAKDGQKADDILKFYYQGVTIELTSSFVK